MPGSDGLLVSTVCKATQKEVVSICHLLLEEKQDGGQPAAKCQSRDILDTGFVSS